MLALFLFSLNRRIEASDQPDWQQQLHVAIAAFVPICEVVEKLGNVSLLKIAAMA